MLFPTRANNLQRSLFLRSASTLTPKNGRKTRHLGRYYGVWRVAFSSALQMNGGAVSRIVKVAYGRETYARIGICYCEDAMPCLAIGLLASEKDAAGFELPIPVRWL